MWHDVRQAVRTLSKHPGFTAMAAVVLGLGVGLNTAIFSVVYAMLFKPLPVADPASLVSIYWTLPRQADRPSVLPNFYYDFFREHGDGFTDLTGHWGISYLLRANDETDRVDAEWVMANYFDLLGVKPILGRTFLPREGELSNPERAVVISHSLWVRRFASDPQIVGKSITLTLWGRADLPFTVIGVTGPDFKGISTPWKPTQLWTTFAQGGAQVRDGRLSIALAVIGRVKPGVSRAQALAVVSTLGRQYFYSRPSAKPEYEPHFAVFRTDDVRMPFDPSAVLIPARVAGAMTLVVAIVLLVAAANVAGILMARGVGRTGEIVVRRVLGASALRIARQLLAESLMLSALGGAIGTMLAVWLLHLFRAYTPSEFALDVPLETSALLFTALVCGVCGLVVGVLPVVQATRSNLQPLLAGSGGVPAKPARRRMRHAITVPQVACSLALLLVAGGYIRTLLDVELADLGYQPKNLVVLRPALKPDPSDDSEEGQRGERYAARSRRFYAQLLSRMRAVPGTTDDSLPLREASYRPNWSALSQAAFAAGNRDGRGVERASVSPGYFRAMGMAVTAGRDFDERDTMNSQKVAIVSANLAQQLWPGSDPIGRVFTVLNNFANSKDKVEWYELVGVVNEVNPILHDLGTRPVAYFPMGQEWRPAAVYAIARASGDLRTVMPPLRLAVASSDLFAEVTSTMTMSQMVATILYPRRIAAAVLSASGIVALMLAAIGVYGVVSYSVAQRTGEIGVRMALGAERRDVIRLVLGEGGRIALIGGLAGVTLGYASVRSASSRFLSLPQLDALTVVAMSLLLGAIVLLACYLPAKRAGGLDPMDVLRRS
jgi:putative ABC transport system permease protein